VSKKQAKLSDAKIGDTVEIFLDNKTGGYGSWVKTDLTLKATLVGLTSYGSAILGWKEKPEEARNFSWMSNPAADATEKVANFDDFKHFCQYGNTECNILTPVMIPLSAANVGDRVRIPCLGEWLSSTPQTATIDATVIGNQGNSVLLGLDGKNGLAFTMPIAYSGFTPYITLDGAATNFKFGRWASGGFNCEVLSAAPQPNKDGIVPVSEVKIGSRVKVFYNPSTGLLSSKDTGHSFEATVIGSSVNVLLGIHAADFDKATGLTAVKGIDTISTKHIKVNNKNDYLFTRWATRSEKCVVLPYVAEIVLNN
jgi:hypothetical protein